MLHLSDLLHREHRLGLHGKTSWRVLLATDIGEVVEAGPNLNLNALMYRIQ